MNEDKKSLGDLRTELNISSTTAIHALRELEKSNLAFQDKDKNYTLTKIGRIITLKVADFSNTVDILKKHERFWLEHDLSGIPDDMMEKIGWLKGSTLIEDTPTDIFKVHANFVSLLSKAKVIKGVSSIFVPEFMKLFEDLIINKNVEVELIFTKEVAGKIDDLTIEKIFNNKGSKLKLYITKEDMKAAFTVTDSFLSFGLFHIDGSYDYNRDLITYDKKGIEWGRDLYEWYLQRAERV
ncbi:MAG: DUF1724 domain-containing protein [Candidatus Methanoperedens sp.]|nr:DUF1724 domain-containing protein [Candidatus Methanoperedens sp.]